MWCKQTFAQIKDGIVMNDIVCDNYELANILAREFYGVDAIAVDTTQYPVSIGNKYINGMFYEEDGITIIPRQNTAEEEIIALRQENTSLVDRLSIAEGALNEILLK